MRTVNSNRIVAAQEESMTRTIVRLLPIVLQLSLIAGVVAFFNIEADLGLTDFFPWMCGGFAFHALIPLRFRPIFLFALFVWVLSIFVGEWGTLYILGIVFLTIGVCHLPISIQWRRGLAIGLAITLGLATLGYFPTFMSSYSLRIVTTLLMFRTILYLYDLPKEKETVNNWQRINYFFMLPNIIIPLFPIVDYQKHKRLYYNTDAIKIYQSGINLIAWSLICILGYRFLYHFAVPNQLELAGVQEIAFFVLTTYLTVIRLIGLLSLSVGILRLFGYNLPDIFNYMFFASSFSDLFRRINIYWKDFLIKLCYYPTYFRVRKWAPTYALAITTLVTFFFTWFFHDYQWFWILGTNPLSETSMIYWGVFGIIATLNALSEQKRKRNKTAPHWDHVTIHTAKVFTTFIGMALLYSVWMAPTFKTWFGMLITALQDSWFNWLKVGMYILGAYLISCFLYSSYLNKASFWNDIWKRLQRQVISINCSVLLLLLGFSFLSNTSTTINLFVKDNQFNKNDINAEYSGYYSEILNINDDISSRIWSRDYAYKKGQVGRFHDATFVRPVNNVLGYELIPNSKDFFKGKKVTINSWGFRDKEYTKLPAQNTTRIALVGSSPTMGSGVADEEVFETLIEQQLNEQYGASGTTFELLNFAQPSLCAFHYVYQIENKIRHFKPDYILFVEHCRPMAGFSKRLCRALEAENELYPKLATFTENKQLNLETMKTKTQMAQKGALIANFSYQLLKETCDKYKINLIWAHIPPTNKDNYYTEYKGLVDRQGYQKQINLSNIYDNYSSKLLVVGANDYHPNAWAHQIIADNLFLELEKELELRQNPIIN